MNGRDDQTPIARSSGPGPEIALLERRTEQAVLSSVLRSLSEGRAAVVTLTGRPGHAQNALLRWAARRAEDGGLRVLRARAAPSEAELRHGAVVQLMTTARPPALPDGTGPSSARTPNTPNTPMTSFAPFAPGPLLDRFHGSLPDRPPDALPGLDELLDSAHTVPTLLVIEESQWLDPASLHWLHALVRRLTRDTPLAVLAGDGAVLPRGGERPDLLPPAPVTTKRLVVRGLSEHGVAAAVELCCGTAGDRCFVAAAAAATAGNPALLCEVLRRFTDGGHAPLAAGLPAFYAVTAAALGDHAVRVLDGLPAEATALLRSVAVCGDLLGFPLVRALAGLSPARGRRLRGMLETLGLTVSSGPHARVRLPVVRARVLGDMPGDERAALHARAAELAHRARAGDPAVARLLLGAPPLGTAWVVPVLRRSAAGAHRAGGGAGAEGGELAVAYLARALKEPLDVRERGVLALRLAAAEAVRAPEAADRALAELARAAGDMSAVAGSGPGRVAVRALDVALARGGGDRVRLAAADALTAVPLHGEWPGGEPPGDARPGDVRDGLSALFWLADEVRDGGEPMVPGTPPLPARPASPAQAAVRAWQLAARGDGLAATRTLARAALAGGTPGAVLVMPRLAACRALALADDCDEAAAELDTLLTAVRRERLPAPTARVLTVRAALHLHAGRIDAAERDINTALRALPATSWHPLIAPALAALRVTTAIETGDIERARALATEPAPLGAEEGVAWAALLCARARLAAAEGRWADARELATESGRRLLRRRWLNPALLGWRALAAQACHALGDRTEAARLSQEERSLARRWGSAGAIALAELWTARTPRADGGGAERHRDKDSVDPNSVDQAGTDPVSMDPASVEVARAAVRALRDTPAQLSYLWGLFQLATAELASGDHRAAARSVAGLTAFTAAHPASLLARRVHGLTERPAWSAPDAPPVLSVPPREWAGLTRAEQHTATLAGQGIGNREIAATLGVSRRTVELRLSNTYRKLRIADRAGLRALVRTAERGPADAS